MCGVAVLMLSACGGGGSGSGSGGTGGTGGSGGGGGASTFTIGGSISGLSSGGLQLTDNGADTLSVPAGATSFTFATKLASGAAYSVAVAAQPTGATCKVTSATGTATANVTSVMVACSGGTFTIAGTVSGLTTAGLKLQYYSGGEVLAVAPGASTFAFTQPVPYGTSVKMVVASQPAFETCTPGASNFSGAIDANITTDTVSCAAAAATVSLFAGSTTMASGNANGTGSAATFSAPAGVAIDSSGNLYVAEYSNNDIRKITPAGVVTLFAGSPTGAPGNANGTGSAATFHNPTGVAVDAAGNVYVADESNNEIRMITPAGVVTTFAGSGTAGNSDGTGTAATFNTPDGIAIDSTGNLWVTDSGNNEIRKITTPGAVVTTWAGNGTAGHANGSGTSATFSTPTGIAVDSAGNLYVADRGNNEIRKIDSSDVVTLFAGSSTAAAGSADGTGTAATFNGPFGIATDAAGNVYVADENNQEIRMITPNAAVTTLAGSPLTSGNANGTGSAATFNYPVGIVADGSGDLYVGDNANNEIRKLVP